MKQNLLLLALLTLNSWCLIGQEGPTYSPISECADYNSFLNVLDTTISSSAASIQNYDSLYYYADTIYPYGLIYLYPTRLDSLGGIEDLYPFFGIDTSAYKFRPVDTFQSRLNDNKMYIRFQQHYKNVKVRGGGYTAGYFIPGPGFPPPGPCMDHAYRVSPFILDSIDVSTSPSVAKSALDDTLGVSSIDTAELAIHFNINSECSYNLIWEVKYVDTFSKIAWIDAHDGEIHYQERRVNGIVEIDAMTEIYDQQTFHNRDADGQIFLESGDRSVRIYDWSSFTSCETNVSDYTENVIPAIDDSLNEWPTTSFSEAIYQAYFVTDSVYHTYSELGIDFGTIHVGADCQEPNAYNSPESTLEEAYISLGNYVDVQSDTFSTAVFDIVGHEVGHAVINAYLNPETRETGPESLHEGIADILGTYIESVYQMNSPDWIIGDDWGSADTIRDLENPRFTCFDSVDHLDFHHRYLRGLVIGHWFYLVSEGNSNNGFPTLDMDNTILILLDALANINYDKGDFPDLMHESLRMIEENYGRCSDEFIAFAAAWNEICLNTGFTDNDLLNCTYSLDGGRSVCEENDHYKTCVDGGPVDSVYHWTIIGKKSTQFKIWGNQIGNSWTGGRCLEILDFPKFPYYPQFFTVQVRSHGIDLDLRMDVKLVDCDHDDPTCEEYHESNGLAIDNQNLEKLGKVDAKPITQNNRISDNSTIHHLQIYNTIGQLLYSGKPSNYSESINREPEVLIFVYYDKEYNIIETRKIIQIR